MTDLKDILNDGSGNIPEDKLMAYLEGRLSPEEQRDIERMLTEEGMESDSMEGLKALSSTEAKHLVSRINYKLEDSLNKNKNKRKKPIKNNYWALIAIIVILLICLAGYAVLVLSVKK